MRTVHVSNLARGVLATACLALSLPADSADFPALGQQIEMVARPLGVGSCATQRTGVWLADGGLIIEIQKPRGVCNFESLDLVIEGKRIPLTKADGSFYRDRKVINGVAVTIHEWYRGDSGKVFFKTNEPVNLAKIQGILEPKCATVNCLNEAAALEATK